MEARRGAAAEAGAFGGGGGKAGLRSGGLEERQGCGEEQFARAQRLELVGDAAVGLGAAEFGGAEFAGGEIEGGEANDATRSLPWRATAQRKLFSSEPSCESAAVPGVTTRVTSRRTSFLVSFGILDLVADGDLISLANELGDVAFGGVVGNSAHGEGDAIDLLARGEGDLELARGDDGVIEEELVESRRRGRTAARWDALS